MKKKLQVIGVSLVAVSMALMSAAPAYAAVDRFVVLQENIGSLDGKIAFTGDYMDGSTIVESYGDEFFVGTSTTSSQITNSIKKSVSNYATGQGYSLPNGLVYPWAIFPDITALSPSVATTTRSLNSAFQVSSTRYAFVSYTVDVAATISLTTGQVGTVVLETADDSGFTTNVSTVQSSVNGNSGSLSIGLNLTQTSTASLTGMVPAGKWVRIRTVNTVGTPTFTYRAGQETLMF